MVWLSSAYLSSIFSDAVGLLKIYTEMLMKLRLIADSKLSGFQSEGFRNLLTMLQRELDDDYFAEVQSHLDDLKDCDGMLVSSTLGNYMQGVGYVLRRKTEKGSGVAGILPVLYYSAPTILEQQTWKTP
jgi:hypothetical protein